MTFDSQRLSNPGGSQPDQLTSDFYFGSFKILEAIVEPGNSDSFDAVVSSSLSVLGWIESYNFSYTPSGSECSSEMRYLRQEDGAISGAFFPDVLTELRGEVRVLCLEVRREPFWSEERRSYRLYHWHCGTEEKWAQVPMIMRIALLPVSSQRNTYRRVVLVRWIKRDLFIGANVSEIYLVWR